MIPLYTSEIFNNAHSKHRLPLKCEHCGTNFEVEKSVINRALHTKKKNKLCSFCSQKCSSSHRYKDSMKKIKCTNCDKIFMRKISELNQLNNFCSQSCAATYNNKHKTKGNKRSKLEQYLESELIKLYPELYFQFNSKTAIGSELDIYIPSLKLAFELNGIFHYEPIFGEKKFNQIKDNDYNKLKACYDNKIDICIIDASGMKYFKIENAVNYLNIITKIINER